METKIFGTFVVGEPPFIGHNGVEIPPIEVNQKDALIKNLGITPLRFMGIEVLVRKEMLNKIKSMDTMSIIRFDFNPWIFGTADKYVRNIRLAVKNATIDS
ncbi:MAG: hypothetical protein KKH98_09125, partial [Spirochaetes bacterium]|nr:hypothetical protein [Spirochaetota bacterium]